MRRASHFAKHDSSVLVPPRDRRSQRLEGCGAWNAQRCGRSIRHREQQR